MTKKYSGTVGYVGLGEMGGGITSHLAEVGVDLVVTDLKQDAVDAVVALGARAAVSLQDLAESSDVIVICVDPEPQVRAVLDLLLPFVRAGQTIIVQSSVPPRWVDEMAAKAAAVGATLFDASVSGDAKARRNGTLAVLVGAKESEVGPLACLLESMGRPLYLGVLGAGEIAKLANNSVGSLTRLGIAEALELTRAYGLSEPEAIEAMKLGDGNCSMLHRWPVFDHHILNGFTMRMGPKQSAMIVEVAAAKGVRLRMTEATRDLTAPIIQRRHVYLDSLDADAPPLHHTLYPGPEPASVAPTETKYRGTVGCFGLAGTGERLATRLAELGVDLVVADLDHGPVDRLVARGARAAGSLKDLATSTDVIFISVAPEPEVRRAFDELLPHLRAGQTVIVQCSAEPGSLEEMAKQAAAVGAVLFDAPVIDDCETRRTGRLSVLVGAREADVGELTDLLESIGRIRYLGVLGGGEVARLAGESVGLLIRLATQEAMEFARAYDLSEDNLFRVIKISGANCSVVHEWESVDDQVADGSLAPLIRERSRVILAAAEAKGVHMYLQKVVQDHAEAITRVRHDRLRGVSAATGRMRPAARAALDPSMCSTGEPEMEGGNTT